jgi:hypothetical protein
MVDTRKWLLSKALPKIYGDKVTVAGDRNAPLVHEIRDDSRVPISDFLAEFAASRGRVIEGVAEPPPPAEPTELPPVPDVANVAPGVAAQVPVNAPRRPKAGPRWPELASDDDPPEPPVPGSSEAIF